MTPERQQELWEKVRGAWAVELEALGTIELQRQLDELDEPMLRGTEICRVLTERRANIPKVIWERSLRTQNCPSAMELVLPRWVDDGTPRGHIEVYLTRRESDDPNWKDQPYHTPGTYFIPEESDEETAVRLAAKELRPATLVRWQKVDSKNMRHDYRKMADRASTRSVVYCGWLEGQPAAGKWFSLLDVLKGEVPIIDSHFEILLIGILPILGDPPRFDH